jgi:hypothetical protein
MWNIFWKVVSSIAAGCQISLLKAEYAAKKEKYRGNSLYCRSINRNTLSSQIKTH